MHACSHSHLVLIPRQSGRLQCRHCHLTITASELGNSYCPECYDVSGKRRYDFQEVQHQQVQTTQYRCEDCGVTIDCD